MSRINLDYINASHLTELLSRPLTKESVKNLVEDLQGLIIEDVARGQGYIEKYDNQWDRAEGVDVSELKGQLSQIETNMRVLEDLLVEAFQSEKQLKGVSK